MKKFAIATAAATALTLTLANAAFAAEQTSQGSMVVAANASETMDTVATEGGDTWITTKVKANLFTEKGIPGSDIKVETSHGVVSLSSDVKVTSAVKAEAVKIAKDTKHVKGVTAEALKTE